MKGLHGIAFILVVVGGLNWGLMGLGSFMGQDWNVVSMALGFSTQLEALVYVLVGLSAAYLAWSHKDSCKYCTVQGGGMQM